MKKRNRSGFTLIELLAVIVVILILSGIIFRMGASAGTKIKIAETAKRLEHLKLCLEEYYVKYGQYPPVPDSMGTECYWVNGNWRFGMEDEYDAVCQAYAEGGENFNDHGHTLPSYLTTRSILSDVMTDAEIAEYRDETGFFSFWPTEDFGSTNEYGPVMEDSHASVGHYIFSNRVYEIHDAWGGRFHYDPRDGDWQSYRIWSNGPDGVANTADDIGHDSFVN